MIDYARGGGGGGGGNRIMIYDDRDVESIFAVAPLPNDKCVIEYGSKFIKNCLANFYNTTTVKEEEKEEEEEEDDENFQLITKSTKEYLIDLTL